MLGVAIAGVVQRPPDPLDPPQLSLTVAEEDKPHPSAQNDSGGGGEGDILGEEEQSDKRAAADYDSRQATAVSHPPM